MSPSDPGRATSGRQRRSAKSRAFALGVAFVVLSGVVSWNYFVHNGPWRSDQVRSADAVVTDVRRGRSSDRVTVAFVGDGGKSIVAETRVVENSVDEGERLRVEYTQGGQLLVRVPGNWRPAYVVFGVYAAATLLVCLGWTCVHLVRTRLRFAA